MLAATILISILSVYSSAIDVSKRHLRNGNGYPQRQRKVRKDNTTITNAAMISSSRTSLLDILDIDRLVESNKDEEDELLEEEEILSDEPTYYPTIALELEEVKKEEEIPVYQPTYYPTIAWDGEMIEAPADGDNNPYLFGSELIAVPELGIEVSSGLNVKLIAREEDPVQFANGDRSVDSWHTKCDAAGIVLLDPENPTESGYVYMSNSEVEDYGGGVYGLYFDRYGNITDYKPLLQGTSKINWNCKCARTSSKL